VLPFLRKLFNILFRNGEFPTQWATSVIKPIFKKGDSENPSNYRGIALIDVLSKLYIYINYYQETDIVYISIFQIVRISGRLQSRI